MRPVFGIFLILAVAFTISFQWNSSAFPETHSTSDLQQAKYDSTQNGKYKAFNEQGALIFAGRYKDGKRHGIFKEYDGTGLLLRKTRYKNGKMKWMQVYKDGKIIEYIDKDGNIRKAKNCGC